MTGGGWRNDFYNPIRRPGTSPVCQLIGVTNYADVRLNHVFIIFGKQLDGKGGRIDLTRAVFGVNIVGNIVMLLSGVALWGF